MASGTSKVRGDAGSTNPHVDWYVLRYAFPQQRSDAEARDAVVAMCAPLDPDLAGRETMAEGNRGHAKDGLRPWEPKVYEWRRAETRQERQAEVGLHGKAVKRVQLRLEREEAKKFH